jgi:hypothetical protein
MKTAVKLAAGIIAGLWRTKTEMKFSATVPAAILFFSAAGNFSQAFDFAFGADLCF